MANDTTLGGYRAWAAESLATHDNRRGTDLCVALAHDTTIECDYRLDAARVLAELGDHRAADVCHTLANDITLNSVYIPGAHHVEAGELLAKLGDVRAANICHKLAKDTSIDRRLRARAAVALAGLSDPRADDLKKQIESRIPENFRLLKIFRWSRG